VHHVREYACGCNPRAHWMSWGVCAQREAQDARMASETPRPIRTPMGVATRATIRAMKGETR